MRSDRSEIIRRVVLSVPLFLGFALPLSAGIIHLTPENSVVETLAGNGSPGSRNGVGGNSGFQWPTGLTTDAKGFLYVADFSNNQIRRVSRDGEVVTLAGTGLGGHADGKGSRAMFHGPQTVALDGERGLIVADAENFRIRRIRPDGWVQTVAGSDHSAYADGPALQARFVYPTGIAVNSEGIIFVADRGSHAIRRITPDGTVSTLAGDGTPGYRDGRGGTARFHDPLSIVIAPSGDLYVADAGNHNIRKITPAGQVITYAGGRLPGFRDGTGAEALFHWPTGLALSAEGELYVSDANNSRIRLIDSKGTVRTLAGTGLPGFSDGPGRGAQFNFPTGLEIDAGGNLYIADSANHLIRKITPGHRKFVRSPSGTASHDG